MNIFSITEGRKKLGELVKIVKYQKQAIALGQHGKPDVLIVAYPHAEGEPSMASMNAESGSFRFLEEEPDLYSRSDLRKRYA